MLGLHFGSSHGSSAATVPQKSEAIDAPSSNALPAVVSLNESFAWCVRSTRLSRSSFYYSFFALPRPLFRDMCVLYAYMRHTDDLGDDGSRQVEERSQSLDQWQRSLHLALSASQFDHPLLPALADVVSRHRIPGEYLFAVIDGVRMDLQPLGFETFDELANYCYHVAGVVGLCSLHIWGFNGMAAIPLAVDCGLAFQFTNILRDVAEDARLGRCYLPHEDLRQFGLTAEEVGKGTSDGRFRELMAWEASRARDYFANARRLVPLCGPAGRPILDAMIRTYSALLSAIEANNYNVHNRRVRLGRCRKLSIVAGSLWRYRRRRDH